MIHGGGDTYIKPEMAQALFELARGPKELWMVPKAKHNQALHVAGDEYQPRVVCSSSTSTSPSTLPALRRRRRRRRRDPRYDG